MNYEKMAPELITMCEDYRTEERTELSTHAHIRVTNLEKPAKRPKVAVFLRCDWEGELTGLQDRDIRVNQKSGKVRTAYLPIEELESLSEDARIDRIIPARQLKMRMDVALPKVHVPQFRATHNLSGRNVVVGIVDSGIDPAHPDFRGRIHSIWDQTADGPGVPEGDFGLEFKGTNLTGSRDTDGHGTHVAGIAAGSDTRFSGVAPAATIVFVKTNFSDAGIADGIRYIFRIAGELGMPAVVNLSLGGHFDAHDGTDELSAMIDQMSGPGRIVCAAAGNEGEDRIHARLKVRPGQVQSLTFSVPPNVRNCILNCWYSGSERIEVAVRHPNGRTTPFQGPIDRGNPQSIQALPNSRAAITTPGPDPANHDHQIFVEISNNRKAIPTGNWTLQFRGAQVTTGQVDAWLAQDNTGIFTSNVDDSFKIGSPGCASQAITVGSFTTRNVLVNRAGRTLQFGLPKDEISPFSSGGPLRNGNLKPDVAAPGAIIVSALSADAKDIDEDDIVADGFMRDQGTSMATPFIVGLVALFLQSNPALTPVAAKALLRANSKVPHGTAGVHDLHWGFGGIDAAAIVTANAATA